MKTKLAILAMLLTMYSCSSEKDRSYYLKEIEKEQAIKESNLKIAADSIVSLSFNGISLGMPFKSSVRNAIKDKKISNVNYNSDKTGLSGRANIYLPQRETPLEVEVLITSLNDTISSICVTSSNYDTRNELIDLYKNRYSEVFANFEHRTGSDSYVWTFCNQTLRVSNFYETEQEVYLKDSRMKSPENRYGVKATNYFKEIVILYNDEDLCARAKKLQNEEVATQKETLRIENEIRNKNIQERANQQDI